MTRLHHFGLLKGRATRGQIVPAGYDVLGEQGCMQSGIRIKGGMMLPLINFIRRGRAAFAAALLILLGMAPISQATQATVSDASYSGSFTAGSPEQITGDATLTGFTTLEGTATNLEGATANGSTSAGTALNSLGTAPATSNAAVTGLSVNDGINNMQTGNFQFVSAFNADTRFFIIESTPVSGTLGDPTEVYLIDVTNQLIGTLKLTMTATNWTSSGANTTNTALACLTYTAGQGTLNQKLGGATFALVDFGGTGNVASATGIRIVSPGAVGGAVLVDANVVGLFSISTVTGSANPIEIIDATYSGAATTSAVETISGNASLTSVRTSQGTFTNLIGATANAVTTVQTPNSVGTAPADNNAAGTGLSANDGVNNMASGNFQFGTQITSNHRIFVLESTPVSATAGDAITVTLIDSGNNPVGTYSLSIAATNFTTTAANTTNTALAALTYNVTQATPQQKLGGVSFSLADFSGAGNISLATGISLTSASVLDPNVVAIGVSSSSSIPTLGEWGMIILAACLLLVAYRKMMSLQPVTVEARF